METGGESLRIRESIRVPFEASVQLRSEEWEDRGSYRTANLSARGVQLRGPLAPSHRGALDFVFESREALLEGRGEVVWLRRLQNAAESGFVMGFRFLELATDSGEAVERLLAAAEPLRGPLLDGPKSQSAPTPAAAEPSSAEVAPKTQARELLLEIEDELPLQEERELPFSGAVDATTARSRSIPWRWGVSAGVVGLVAVVGMGAFARWRSPAVDPLAALPSAASTAAIGEEAPAAEGNRESGPGAAERAAPKPSTEPSKEATRLLSAETDSRAGATRVRLSGNGDFDEGAVSTHFLREENPRFLIKLAGIDSDWQSPVREIGTNEVVRLRSGWHETSDGGELHVVFDLTSAAVEAQVEVVGRNILVSFDAPE